MFNICPNAYYNYLKNRKADYHQQKDEIKKSIREIYHSHGGVDGYRTIHAYLIRKGYDVSRLTVHKYMNTEMQLFSISRKKKPTYEHNVTKLRLLYDKNIIKKVGEIVSSAFFAFQGQHK